MSRAAEEGIALSVVVPALNEEATIVELIERTRAVLHALKKTFEIVVVDDGSTDRTPALLASLTRQMPELRVITLARNFGQAAALSCGLFAARGDLVLTLDADLQNPPEEIPKLLQRLDPDVDLVSGLRSRRPEPWWRYLGSRLVHWIARTLVGRNLRDYGGQFKLYRRGVIEATRQAWAPGKPFFALAVWLGFRVVEVPVRHEVRRSGRSRYNLLSLARLNFDILTSFTTAPLLLTAVGCAGLAVVSLVVGLIGALASLEASLAYGIAFALGASAFLSLATIALYIARLYRVLTGPPLGYVVRSQNPPGVVEPDGRIRPPLDAGPNPDVRV